MKLLFHIGQPKTGSSALQKVLHQNRNVLKQYGILYPDPPSHPSNHGALSSLVFEERKWSRQIANKEQKAPGKQQENARTILSTIEQSLKTGSYHTVVLSSEFFHRKLNEQNVRNLQDLILCYFSEITFVYYVRHPVSHYLSACLQKVHHSSTIPKPKRIAFRQVIESYAAIAPVAVRAYDKTLMPNGDIVSAFVYSFLPECAEAVFTREKHTDNVAVSPEIAAILQEYRSAEYPDEDDTIYQNDNNLKKLLLCIAAEYDLQSSADIKPALASYIVQQNAEQLDWLKRTYGIRFNDQVPQSYKASVGNPPEPQWLSDVCNVDEAMKHQLKIHALNRLLTERHQNNGHCTMRLHLLQRAKSLVRNVYTRLLLEFRKRYQGR